MGKLDGKVALVTGGARGLGRAYARRLGALGARVVVSDLDLMSYAAFEAEAADMTAETTVDEIVAAGGQAMGIVADAGDRAAMERLVAAVSTAWGGVDILVANAGGGRGSMEETAASVVSADLLEAVTRANFHATVHACAAVAPSMKARGGGRIVTVASYGGIRTTVGGTYAHYGANKAAIIHYTRHLAQELGPFGINCNAIAPGLIETARILALVGRKAGDNLGRPGIALRRAGTVEDCAKVVEFLVTDLSDYVTGVVIPVDGGWSSAGQGG